MLKTDVKLSFEEGSNGYKVGRARVMKSPFARQFGPPGNRVTVHEMPVPPCQAINFHHIQQTTFQKDFIIEGHIISSIALPGSPLEAEVML